MKKHTYYLSVSTEIHTQNYFTTFCNYVNLHFNTYNTNSFCKEHNNIAKTCVLKTYFLKTEIIIDEIQKTFNI